MINLTLALMITLITPIAHGWPIWAVCKNQLNERDPRIKQMGQKLIVVQVWYVDRKCAWAALSPKLLLESGRPDKSALTCIKETNCHPLSIVGGSREN